MTYISWSSEFSLYFEDSTLYFGIMKQCDVTFDFKFDVGHIDYILWSSDFAIFFQFCLMDEHHTFG